jgi:glucose-1-phosphate thymidylyltransferase
LVLGENIFFGNHLVELLAKAAARKDGASIFSYRVDDPGRYGVVEVGDEGRVIGLEEKPAVPKSHFAVTGLYFFDSTAVEKARSLKPSARGELGIVDLIRCYLDEGSLHVEQMSRGYAWLDTGTHDSLLEASEFVRTIQRRQGIQIACLEKIAYRLGFIDRAQAERRGRLFGKTTYGRAILDVLDEA